MYAEGQKIAGGVAYIIMSLDFSEKQTGKEFTVDYFIILLKETKSQNKIYLNNKKAKVHFNKAINWKNYHELQSWVRTVYSPTVSHLVIS